MPYVYQGKPPLSERTATIKQRNEACRKVTYRDGDAYECGAPTDGRNYCAACERRLITLTDRPAPEGRRAEVHPWFEEAATKASRAKRRA